MAGNSYFPVNLARPRLTILTKHLLLILIVITKTRNLANAVGEQIYLSKYSSKSGSSPEIDRSSTRNTTAHLVFGSVASLLQQWPNSIYPKGHTIVPGLIPTGTLLYHARPDSKVLLQGFEWLAFDSEMSYGVVAGRGGSSFLLTYITTEPLRVIYVDGQSATVVPSGNFDTQHFLISKRGYFDKPLGMPQVGDEYHHARSLCESGSRLGFDGVVRMNVGFELIWCDIQQGIQLIDSRNITDPLSSPGRGFPIPSDDPTRETPGIPKLPLGKEVFPNTTFSGTAPWEWQRSSAWHYRGENRIKLDYSSILSFYDQSLVPSVLAQRTIDRKEHRIAGISKAEAQGAFARLEEILRKKNREGWKTDGVDWKSIISSVVQRYSDRIETISKVLSDRDNSDQTQVINSVQRLTYGPLSPYLNMSLFSLDSIRKWIQSSTEKCTTIFTSGIDQKNLSASERMLIRSIEGVLSRICECLGYLLERSSIIHFLGGRSNDEIVEELKDWKDQLEELKSWLGWSEWIKCDDRCDEDVELLSSL